MNKVTDFLYENETYLIRKACFNVWKQFGSAYKENVIDRALTIELQKLGLRIEDQKKSAFFMKTEKLGNIFRIKLSMK
ncbi:MAG: GxxExxY protein [Patescibacteria group bacterium]|nr:GxxExxY protein [Patescibacteria group bacterium]